MMRANVGSFKGANCVVACLPLMLVVYSLQEDLDLATVRLLQCCKSILAMFA